mgnify:CR=1 FL=1
MGGFLSGLGTLLGGFNAQRRIDKEGFDWREQSAQQQAMRDRRKSRNPSYLDALARARMMEEIDPDWEVTNAELDEDEEL